MRRLPLLLLPFATACFTREVRPAPVPRVVELIAERETRDVDPGQLALEGIVGEPTAVLRLEGMRARLCADPNCERYPQLIPAFVVEVLDPSGRVRDTFSVGLRGRGEQLGLDVVGLSRSTNQLEIAARLPAHEPFRLRVRGFSVAGQDLYVVFTPTEDALADERAAQQDEAPAL